MNRRIATGIGGFTALILISTGAVATSGTPAPDTLVSHQQVVLADHPADAPICLDSAGFGGVYCIWPEQPRRPARNTALPPPPPPSQNPPPPAPG